MTNEERDLIAKFISRVGGAPQGGGFLGGSVPSTQPQLPPIDKEADSFIAQQFQQSPEARYRITQTALVQEGALAAMMDEARSFAELLGWRCAGPDSTLEVWLVADVGHSLFGQEAPAQPMI